MARQSKHKSSQASFFKKEIPQMPEGYYSSGPNPNLRRFVEEHATPYDPETDDYNVPPFDRPIETTKATAIYNMHTYWSKKPHDAIREYIKHYTKPGDIVLDSMCGSGGTALAALMEGRAAIAIDLSPAATFITKNYCTPVDVNDIQRAFENLKAAVKPKMDWLYETRCDRCDGRATTAYTVYSYVFQCPRCLEKVPLFDCVEAKGFTKKNKPKMIRACPDCYSNGHVEEISTRSKRSDPIPVLVNYFCKDGCKPKRDQRLHNDPNPKKREYFEKFDLHKTIEIQNEEIPSWYPTLNMMNVDNNQKIWGVLWRPYLGGIKSVDQFFTRRNLWSVSKLYESIEEITNQLIRDKLKFCFTSMCLFVTIMHQDNANTGGNISKGTYYVPPVFKDMNVWDAFDRKYKAILRGLKDIAGSIRSTDLIISTSDATNLAEIENESIDYIFTDPPYGGKVQFGELNFVWESWLRLNTFWHDREIIINKSRCVSDNDWEKLIRLSLTECYRVLKPGRWLSLCFHDTSEGTWQLVQDIASEIGLISERSDNTLFIDVAQKSWKQLVSDKITRRDLVINFRKSRSGELRHSIKIRGNEDSATFIQKAFTILAEVLEKHPGSTADRLYDEIVSRMVHKGEFERHNFDEILRSVAEEVDGRWYLLETVDQIDEAESRKEIDAAAHLEAFMYQYLEENQGEIGVHYSDLFEQYLPIQDKPRRLMQEWLPEFFFKTAEGTWRPPANEEERAQKEALRTSGTLRRIKRFANALLEGVPPHERDVPPNTATAADWIRQCRRAGLYEQGRALYEKGGFTFDGLGEEGQMEVEEDYQVCVRRS